MRCNFLFLKCLAFSTMASHNSFLTMLWHHLSPVLRKFSGMSFENSVQSILHWCLSSSLFPLCSPHVHSSEWLQYWAINHCILLLNHFQPQVFQSECLQSLDLQEKVCVASGSGTKPGNLGESYNFSEAQRRHFVNFKALTKGKERSRGSVLHLQVGVLLHCGSHHP